MGTTLDLLNVTYGFLTPWAFKSRMKFRWSSQFKTNNFNALRDIRENSINYIIDLDLAFNRLLCGYLDSGIALYDVSLSFDKEWQFELVAEWGKFRPVYHVYGTQCVKWRKCDCEIFTSTGLDNKVSVMSVSMMKQIDSIEIPTCKWINYHAYNAYDQDIIGAVAQKGHIHLLDLRMGGICQIIKGSFGEMNALSWSPVDCKKMVVGSDLGNLICFDIRSPKKCYSNNFMAKSHIPHPKNPVFEFLDNGMKIICLSVDRRVLMFDIYNLESAIFIDNLDIQPNRRHYKFAISDGDPQLLYLPGKHLTVYTLSDGKFYNELEGHSHDVVMVIYNKINNELYSVADDHHVLVWK